MRKIIPTKLWVARMTFAEEVADIKTRIPAGAFKVADKQKGFCGFTDYYQRGTDMVLFAKYQRQSIPAAAVTEEAARLFDTGDYATLTRKELKEVARDILEQRVPFTTAIYPVMFIHETGNTWYAVGINMPYATFREVVTRIEPNTENISGNPLLDLIADNDAELIEGVLTTDGETVTTEFAIGLHSEWFGKYSGLSFASYGAKCLMRSEVQEIVNDDAVVCSQVQVHTREQSLLLKRGNAVGIDKDETIAFDFGQTAKDTGEAISNFKYWRDTLLNVAEALNIITNGALQVVTDEN